MGATVRPSSPSQGNLDDGNAKVFQVRNGCVRINAGNVNLLIMIQRHNALDIGVLFDDRELPDFPPSDHPRLRSDAATKQNSMGRRFWDFDKGTQNGGDNYRGDCQKPKYHTHHQYDQADERND